MKKIVFICVALLIMVGQLQNTFALDDGAYLIGCSASYVNPLTNETEDGGTNIALGNSMVSSIVEKQLLLEQTAGKIYITVGLGLASNVSNVRFQLMDSNGSKKTVSAKKTGSSTANGDTVNHYRIQVSSLSQYISPIMYVDPMGRDVQFFIKLNSSSITAGTGVYTSEMVKKATTSDSSQSSNQTTGTKKDTTQETTQETVEETTTETKAETTVNTDVSKESLLKDVTGLSYHTIELSESNQMIYIVVATIAAIGLMGGIFYVKKYCKKIKK